MREIELTCVGPAEVALGHAAEYGIPVRCYTHRGGGLVCLRVPSDYLADVERWYASSFGHPGDCVGYAVLAPARVGVVA
jgi:hypothetical protein